MSTSEYFTVNHTLKISLETLAPDTQLPNEVSFEAEIPDAFKIASQFSSLDNKLSLAYTELTQRDLPHVIELLEAQSSKIDLMIQYFISLQKDDGVGVPLVTTHFGASELGFISQSSLPLGSLVRLNIYLDSPSAAIYCYASVTHVKTDEQGQTHVTLSYERIREQDRDLLIKAALVQQQKLLRQRSLNKQP